MAAAKPTNGTIVSFGNTPQAKDDLLTNLGTEDTSAILYLDVMANDLAGKAKSLWSTDDGISEGGIRPTDLLSQDAINAVGSTRLGALIWITADGKIAYQTTAALRATLQSLSVGQTATDSFTYAIQMGNEGTLSWAQASVTLTGTNDTPIVENVSIAVVEDGPAVIGDFNGDDIDSDDDGTTLQYALTSQPAIGTLSNNANGTFTYNPGSNFQELAVGETASLAFTYTATDKHGAVSAPATGTITVTGVNDAPVIADPGTNAAGAVKEDTTLSASGQLAATDVDNGATQAWSVLATTGTYGTMGVDGSGKWTYALANGSNGAAGAVQGLAAGQTETDSFTIRVDDGKGGTDEQVVTVTVTGVNDAPVIGDPGANAAGAVKEDTTLSASGQLAATDIDNGATQAWSVLATAGAYGAMAVDGSGKWTYTLANGSNGAAGAVQGLAAGQTKTESFTLRVDDSKGGTDDQVVAVTVTGVNDAPVINGGDPNGAVTAMSTTAPTLVAPFTVQQFTNYGGSFSLASLESFASSNKANYTVSANVIDYTDDPAGFAGEIPGSTPWPAASATGASGTGGISDRFFARISGQLVVSATDTYAFRTYNDDGVYVKVNNQLIINDPGIHAEEPRNGSITLTPGVYPVEVFFFENYGEASLEFTFKNSSGVYGHVNAGKLTDTGIVNFADVDLSDTHTVSVAGSGALGTLSANVNKVSTGTGTGGQVKWNYEVDNKAVAYLNAGETTVETFTVTVDDGKGGTAQQAVNVTITGINDAPTLQAASEAIDEDGQAVSVDLATLGDDVDSENDGSNLVYTLKTTPPAGLATISGTTLTIDPATGFQALAAGEEQNFKLTVEAKDKQGATAVNDITVTVTGVNDAPVIADPGVNAAGSVKEDTTLSATGQLTATDVDNGATKAWSVVGATSGTYGSMGVDGSGKWTYTLANGVNGVAGPVQGLAAGQTVTDSFTLRVDDSKGGTDDQVVTVTVTGVNDAAVISTQTKVLTETNAPLGTGGQLTIADVDSAQSLQAQSNVAGKYGTFGVAADGTWTYAMNGPHNEFEVGKNYSDSFSVTAADGTTKASAVTVTIAGTNDAPLAVDDTNVLTVTSLASQINTTTVKWVDWTQQSVGEVKGIIDLGGGQTIDVTFKGAYTFAQTSGGTDYYTTPPTIPGDFTLGSGTYTSAGVANGPTGSDIIALNLATTRTLTFSQPVNNLFFAVVSLNGNGYRFDQDFDILSYGRGFFGDGSAVKTALPDGRYELLSINTPGRNELHGVLGIKGSVSSLTWDGLSYENWNGFTVGTYGKAQTALASGNLLVNDTDPENDLLTVAAVNGQAIAGNSITLDLASGARVTVSKNGNYDYDEDGAFASLALNETFKDSFTYTAKDSHGATDDAVATITVTGINDAPVVQAVNTFVFEDGAPATAAFSGDDVDSDDDGSSLQYNFTSPPPALGTLTNNGNGTFTYNPGSNYQNLAKGEAEILNLTYTATDAHGAVSAPSTVLIKVGGTNDAPTLKGGSMAALEDGGAVSLNLAPLADDIDSDNTGGDLYYQLVAPAPQGNASFAGSTLSFSPNKDFQGLAAGQTTVVNLAVQATDKHNASVTNTVAVTVTGVNDAPVITGGDASGAVTAVPGSAPFKVEQFTAYPSGDFSLAALQAYAGSHTANYTKTTSIIDYTDDPGGFAGELPGSSPWPAAAATGASGTGGINNSFFARITGQVNVTAADTYTFRTFNDDGVYLRVNNQLIINDPNQHGEQAYTGSIALNPGTYPVELYFFENGGEASLELSYKNSTGAYGLVTSGTLSDSGVVQFGDVDLTDAHTVSVAPAGGPLGTLTAAVTQDTTGSGSGGKVTWNYSVANNTLTALGAGQSKVDSFVVTVADGKGGTAQQQVNVTVNGVNDGPTANGDNGVGNENTPIILAVLANDTDPDSGDTLSLLSKTNGLNGNVSISGSNLVYTPNTGFVGNDSFTYTMKDAGGLTSSANVTVTVNHVNVAPVNSFVQPAAISNGSFESGLTGWTAYNGGVDVVVGGWQAASGSAVVDLNAFTPGGVKQTLTTIVGATYTIGFNLSRNPGADPGATVRVAAGSNTQDFAHTAASSASNMAWQQKYFTFTATSTSTELSFTSLTPNPLVGFPTDAEGPALDNVKLIGPLATQMNTPATFKGLSVFDSDAGGNAIQLNLNVTNGKLSLASTAGLSGDLDGNDGSLALTGSQSALNAALNAGLLFTPNVNYTGLANLTVNVNDLGQSGVGGAQTDTDIIQIAIVGS